MADARAAAASGAETDPAEAVAMHEEAAMTDPEAAATALAEDPQDPAAQDIAEDAAPADDAATHDLDDGAFAADPAGGDGSGPGDDPRLDPERAADAPADGPPSPYRLHRRARHDETEELLAFLRAVPVDAPLTLDASEVDNVSTPYILAIVAAARARAAAGEPAVVASPSPAFVDAFSDLGLFGDLMKMEIRA